MKFEAEILDIPVTIVVTHFSEGSPSTFDDEGEPEEFDFDVLNHRGRPSKTLRRRVTRETEAEIFEIFQERLKRVRAEHEDGIAADRFFDRLH